MDIYSTGYLARVVQSLKRTPAFFLNTFFPMVETSDEEKIYFDVELEGEKRRLAPFVHPLVEGKVVESLGYETRSFTPAYVKDKRVHNPSRAFKRVAGENIGTGQALTAGERAELAIRRDVRDQTDIWTRRLEVMAVESILTGQETVNMKMPSGPDKTVVVDFGRDPGQSIVLTGAARWGQPGVVPTETIEDAALATLQLSGSSVRNIVMDPDAWKSFRANDPLLDKKLDLRRVVSGEINLGLLPDHVTYKGNDGAYDYWVYADWYINDAGTEVPMLPSGTVCGVGDIMGVRHFGAIKDHDANFMETEYFTKSWVQKDPSVRFLLGQSAPLIVPYRVNACFTITIDGGQ